LFIEANADQVRSALSQFDGNPHLVFTAHSIPESMAVNCEYVGQLTESSRLVAETLGQQNWQLVYQSRSGSPMIPWLGPDVCDHLRELKATGVTDVVVAPIGFISDHMEVIYDLDVQAKKVADGIGLNMVRAATAGTHPLFVKMIRELILERTDGIPVRTVGLHGPSHDVCPDDCCV
jgi:ferrochelatase